MNHDCPLPNACRKYRHRLWICDCGKAYTAFLDTNWAASIWTWKRWKP